MATSQNGWSAGDRSVIATYTVPGTTLRVPLRKGDVSVVLLEYLRRYHVEVESLYNQPQDLWGYAHRTIRGSSTTLSNHASGTAVDARAVKNGLGARGTFTPVQGQALDRLIGAFDGVLRHGRGWTRPDPMHVEICAGPDAVKRVADRIRGGISTGIFSGRPTIRRGATGEHVRVIQRVVGVRVDGDFGPATETAVRRWQKAKALTVDGVVGPASWRAMP